MTTRERVARALAEISKARETRTDGPLCEQVILERMLEEAVAEEREACAMEAIKGGGWIGEGVEWAELIAAAIRLRSVADRR